VADPSPGERDGMSQLNYAKELMAEKEMKDKQFHQGDIYIIESWLNSFQIPALMQGEVYFLGKSLLK
jgi:hypothetical protein